MPFGVYGIVQVMLLQDSHCGSPLKLHLELQHPAPNTATSILRAFAGQLVPNPSLQQVCDASFAVYLS